MIKKQLTITFIAILIAAVSVAATITMVQADLEAGTKATFELDTDIGTPHSNPALGGDIVNHDYDDVSMSVPGTVLNTPGGSLLIGNFDASEPAFQAGGLEPVPGFGSPFTLFLGAIPFTTPLKVVKGHEEANFSFIGLVPGNQYRVTAIIADMDDFGLTVGLAGPPALETVFVTDSNNGVDIGIMTAVPGAGTDQTIISTHPIAAVADATGTLTIGFNELFTWDAAFPVATAPLVPVCGNIGTPLPCIGSQTGIRVEQISIVDLQCSNPKICKTITFTDADGDGQIEVGEVINYRMTLSITNPSGTPWSNTVVTDRFGAELDVTGCTQAVDLTTKGNSDKVFLKWTIGTLAAGDTAVLVCDVVTDLTPGGDQSYTECSNHEFNSGAVAKFTVPKANGKNPQKISQESGGIIVSVLSADHTTGDCDNDGFTDLEELIAGTDPHDIEDFPNAD